jgi:hypothetical protein
MCSRAKYIFAQAWLTRALDGLSSITNLRAITDNLLLCVTNTEAFEE